MVEECRKRNFTAHLITCHKIDGKRLGALRGLCVGSLYPSYQRLVIAEREIKVERKVVGGSTLRTDELHNPVKIGNLHPRTNRQLLACGFHNLSGR